MQHIESTLEGADGTSLFMLRHELDEPKAAVVILHGYCEHCLRYGHVVDHFEKQGLNSYLIDHRGHGRSEGPRAAVLRWEEYLDDVEIFLAEVRKHYTEGPLFLLGHSMGGLIATSYVLNRKPKLDGVILSSPYLGLKADVPQWKAVAGKVMSRLWPSISLKSDLDPHLLSHDQAVVQDYISDPNVPKLANARWFTESNKWQEYVQEKASGWGLPALVMHGGGRPHCRSVCNAPFSRTNSGQLG